jgi:hypothetical protein
MTTEKIKAEISQFNKERNEALLSMEEQKIRDMVRKWNRTEMPSDMNIFWATVHKAITGAMSLPIEFRRKSKQWLDERGLKSHDDGEL